MHDINDFSTMLYIWGYIVDYQMMFCYFSFFFRHFRVSLQPPRAIYRLVIAEIYLGFMG